KSLEGLIAALQLLPLHGKRRVEENHNGFGRAVHRSGGRRRVLSKPEQGLCLEESGLIRAAPRSSFGWRWLAADRIAVGEDLPRVGGSGIQIVGDGEIFSKIDTLTFEVAGHQVRRVLLELQWEGLRWGLKVPDRVRGAQFKIDAKMMGRLRLVRVRV